MNIDAILNNLEKSRFRNSFQTPLKQVHPVFIAQHATATCCRGCLYKWHHIKKGKQLSSSEIDYIVNVIIAYIKRETDK